MNVNKNIASDIDDEIQHKKKSPDKPDFGRCAEAIEPDPDNQDQPFIHPNRQWESILTKSDLIIDGFNTKDYIGMNMGDNSEAITKLRDTIVDGNVSSAVHNNLGCAYCFMAFGYEKECRENEAEKQYIQAKLQFQESIRLNTSSRPSGKLNTDAENAKHNLSKLKENGVI